MYILPQGGTHQLVKGMYSCHISAFSALSAKSAAAKWRRLPWPSCIVSIISFLLVLSSPFGYGGGGCIPHTPSSMSLHVGDDSIIYENGRIPGNASTGETLSTSRVVRGHLEHSRQSQGSIGGGKGDEEGVISHKPEERQRVNSLRLMLLTWNLGETSPPAEDCKFISEMASHDDADVVCLAVQEVENIKPRRHEGRRSRKWKYLQWKALGNSFIRVGHHTMGAMQLSIYVRRALVSRVRLMKMKDVACGVGNVLQNKGAVACFLRFDKTTFVFIAAHLAAHQSRLADRNGDYWRIMGELEQEVPLSWIKRAMQRRRKADKTTMIHHKSEHRALLLDVVDRVFFFGDLNYRIDLGREDVERALYPCISKGRRWIDSHQPLDFDQLNHVRMQGAAFGGFHEGRVTFQPTYKLDRGRDTYDSSAKRRIPAWTDRILYAPDSPEINVTSYDSFENCRHSDHRPVMGHFVVQC